VREEGFHEFQKSEKYLKMLVNIVRKTENNYLRRLRCRPGVPAAACAVTAAASSPWGSFCFIGAPLFSRIGWGLDKGNSP
jgi:hypothetical protein